MGKDFLPISGEDFDIIIVTGDAYNDHPSYGPAVIGRVLVDAGFKVGIISQPDWKSPDDFKRLGRPGLFFGVTAGNLDSMVANYTANKKPRSYDEYSPGGRPALRPDRAGIIYTNKIRQAFPNVSIVLGGIEASMRRLAHYDYWSDNVRRSVLLDAKADILVYGMGESQILEIAQRLKKGDSIKTLDNIRGTVVIRNNIEGFKDYILVPSYEEVSIDKDKFNQAFRTIYQESDPVRGKAVIQKHGARFLIQLPPALPLSTKEMDRIYGLDYMWDWHPVYDKEGGVPGYETVRFSIISHRGCSGGCNFCALYLHQGRIIQSRSVESIIKEVKGLTEREDFRGTITDIGGPTANLYGAECSFWSKAGACPDKSCLTPEKCKNLKLGYDETLRLWKEITRIPKVEHLFIGSGVRYDLLIDKPSSEYLKELCSNHVSGQLKVAPEHSDEQVLSLMNKPSFKKYETFVRRFNEINKRLNKEQYLVNYFIVGHPGAGLKEALELALLLRERHINPEQVQDFIPLPTTASGCMYYTESDPFTGKTVYVAKGARERKQQRALLQSKNPENRKYVIEALKKLGKLNLKNKLFH